MPVSDGVGLELGGMMSLRPSLDKDSDLAAWVVGAHLALAVF